MSSDNHFLVLRLIGPLQSWGFDSQYSRRNTGLMPTKSGVAGMCCAALGYSRGSVREKDFLQRFAAVKMTAVAISRVVREKKVKVGRLQDYHTVQGTRKAKGGIKKNHITHRQYLTDASFGVILRGDPALLAETAAALKNPTWGIWLGRKTCIPSAPVFAGLKEDLNDALKLLIGTEPLGAFTRQEEVTDFEEGRDTLPDSALSFASSSRSFSQRRVKTIQALQKF
jgi:CRISPR system Cascade subunit CasD